MLPKVVTLDHLVLTVADINTTVIFYETILGMTAEQFTPADGSKRWALKFGTQKINLHQAGESFAPYAGSPTVGSADLCFLSETKLRDWQSHLSAHDIVVELGPIDRTGATGAIRSLYFRDPDQNLIEVSNRS